MKALTLFTQAQRSLCRTEPFSTALLGNLHLPIGCVIAVCDLAAVYPTSKTSGLLNTRSQPAVRGQSGIGTTLCSGFCNHPMKKRNTTIQFRQGDVLLIKSDSIPSGDKTKAENGRLILARGEATGHHHSVLEDDAELIQEGERMLLNVLRETSLVHQEHGAIVIAAGVYEIKRQREYSPEAIRNVAD
jgi:hypothetical protein